MTVAAAAVASSPSADPSAAISAPSGSTVFVGNLAWEVGGSEPLLQQAFDGCTMRRSVSGVPTPPEHGNQISAGRSPVLP
eukprot:SAG11_NODE_187_length_13061_cov_10.715322_4_plen_80_part_00